MVLYLLGIKCSLFFSLWQIVCPSSVCQQLTFVLIFENRLMDVRKLGREGVKFGFKGSMNVHEILLKLSLPQ